MLFHNREAAGKLLAEKLKGYFKPNQETTDTIILALPRGGVPIAAEIYKVFHFPIDTFLVRKIGAPDQQELAIGAIAMGGIRVMNDDILEALDIPTAEIEKIVKIEQKELERRNKIYREERPIPNVSGKTVILVDDGLATGATMRSAIKALKAMSPSKIIVATPVSAADTFEEIKTQVDAVVCLHVAKLFFSVGQWYEDFPQVTDSQVKELLNSCS